MKTLFVTLFSLLVFALPAQASTPDFDIVTTFSNAACAPPGGQVMYSTLLFNPTDHEIVVERVKVMHPSSVDYVLGTSIGLSWTDPDIWPRRLIWSGPFYLEPGGLYEL
jgi:hypothetical protein